MLIESLAAVAMVASPGAATQEWEGGVRVAPRGGYRDSCSGEYVNRGRLYADCRDRSGRVRGTSIELNRCGDYEIRNDNGRLVCQIGVAAIKPAEFVIFRIGQWTADQKA